MSLGLGALLVVQLVRLAGTWEVAANTRVLDLLLRGGVVQLTDMDAGYVAGVPDVELYLRSQDPIDWLLLLLAIVLVGGAVAVRALRARAVARSVGVGLAVADALRVETTARFAPFGTEQARFARDVAGSGADLEHVSSVVALRRLGNVLEVAVFATVGLALVGVRAWSGALAWSAIVLLVAWALARPPADARQSRSERRAAVRGAVALARRRPGDAVAAGALALVALPLEELAAYVTVQALTSEHVILGGATPSVLLMAVVAGKLATLVTVTPGGLGQYEWAMAAALFTLGQGLPEAVTITLVFAVVRYAAAALLLLATTLLRRRPAESDHTNGDRPVPQNGETARDTGNGMRTEPVALADVAPPVPALSLLARRLAVLAVVVYALTLLGRLRLLVVDYWLLESLGFETVFWTNFRTGALLFAIVGVAFAAAVIVPWLVHRRRSGRLRDAIAVTVLVAVVAGVHATSYVHTFLLARHGVAFSEDDPVFGHDVAFYVFDLPALRAALTGLWWMLATAIVASVVCRWRSTPRGTGWRDAVARIAHPLTAALVAAAGVVLAALVWLRRFDVLVKDNETSSIPVGAEALDVSGLLSTVNLAWVYAAAIVVVFGTVAIVLARSNRRPDAVPSPARLARLLAPAVVIALVATALVAVRDATAVTPNEPLAQLEYLDRHIEATNRAWGMDEVERVDVEFAAADDPAPDVEALLSHPSIRNAQLWPGAASWLERLLDPQHVDRIVAESDERDPSLVFSATLDTFRQQQKLRPYYDFLDVDVSHYEIDGEPTLVTSAVRELPLLEPQPWLAFWGQRFVLFTHGYGLVAAPLGEVGASGSPVYVSSDVPPVAAAPALETDQHSVYYGEGSGTIGFSNIAGVPEFDYPTEQDRSDVYLPADVDAGIRLDSWMKRLAFAWGTREFFGLRAFFDLAFSDLITDDTRIHVRRQPLDRVDAVAPFLFLDTDPYAVTTRDGITWMVNGMTVADRYPYSAFGELGDKSVRRGPFPVEVANVNYARDAVKATVDAYTGRLTLYQVADEPVIETWSRAYPDLFTPASEMPDEIRDQMQYPPQLFHVQFDDLWIYYHVTDPLAFFNQEDLFDDADEVLGPMLAPGKGITFSMEPYPSIIEPGTVYPESSEATQFAWSQIFTPEGARNLRSIITVYQGGEDYGRLSALQLPKGSFEMGPEQAESVIDQDAEIAQQFGFWNTTGVEVIRGYLTPVIADDELIYVEPVFIRSEQNPFPQLSRVVVVARGEATMGATLEDALRQAYADN
jgi:uncharacterized membrane protein (UPF0182 family)/uncharacterized membrane protein YbhN (UPF0104 family)